MKKLKFIFKWWLRMPFKADEYDTFTEVITGARHSLFVCSKGRLIYARPNGNVGVIVKTTELTELEKANCNFNPSEIVVDFIIDKKL